MRRARHGFLRLHCDACACDRLLPFSCYLELKTIRSAREEGVLELEAGSLHRSNTGKGDRLEFREDRARL